MVERRAKAKEEHLDRVFHALSAQPRRKIVELLREAGELRVTDLADAFSMSLNGVSKHVKALEAAGLVTRRVEWREHWIAVAPGAFEAPYTWISYHHHFWSERLDALADLMNDKATKRKKEP